MPFAGPATPEFVPVPEALIAALIEPVSGLVPSLAAHIPNRAARAVGGWAVPEVHPGPGTTGSVADQLLGALENHLQSPLAPIPELAAALGGREPIPGAVTVAVVGGAGDVDRARAQLQQLAPWYGSLTRSLVAALCENPAMGVYLHVPAGDLDAVLTGHGRGHLAIAVAVAALALAAVPPAVIGTDPAAVIALSVDALAVVLPRRPRPAAYRLARLERDRAEYLLPIHAHGTPEVTGNRLHLLEDDIEPSTAEPANGLVEPVRGGLIVRTGLTEGPVPLWLKVLTGPPADPPDTGSWDEVVECSYVAVDGSATVPGMGRHASPPWPGPIRARVYADGRDRAQHERYVIELWAAPQEPEHVWKASDRLGHRLRGEPELVPDRPEAAYNWVESSALSMAATVTVVSGSTPAQVIAAFGGDPTAPVALKPLAEDFGIEPWVAVLACDGHVLAIELNGWQGADAQTLARASANGEAASVFWNVNAERCQGFAREGRVLASFESIAEAPADLEHLYAGFDPTDFRDHTAKLLLGME